VTNGRDGHANDATGRGEHSIWQLHAPVSNAKAKWTELQALGRFKGGGFKHPDTEEQVTWVEFFKLPDPAAPILEPDSCDDEEPPRIEEPPAANNPKEPKFIQAPSDVRNELDKRKMPASDQGNKTPSKRPRQHPPPAPVL
jgi:hypothetical protein